MAWLLGLPVVAGAQDPLPECPDLGTLDPLPQQASDELREMRGLREAEVASCLVVRSGLTDVRGTLSGELLVTWSDPPPLAASVLPGPEPLPVALSGSQPELEVGWPEEAQAASTALHEAVWVLIGAVLGVALGGILYRAVIG